MIERLRRRPEHGFTLIELLIVVAIIGIIAAILIPNLIDALQKAKQKRTVADMRNTGTAWMSWLTDQISSSAAGGVQRAGEENVYTWFSSTIDHENLLDMLKPSATFFYMQEVPEFDGWKNAYEFGYGGDDALLQPQVLGIRSAGRDGEFEGETYTTGAFISTDYIQDIVWTDGYFVRWPGGVRVIGQEQGN